MAAMLSLEVGDELELFLAQEFNKELLRFTTAGSVDDGKSTLIGRLLHDCKAVYEDQLDSVKKSRINRSGKAIDFSLLTDGLRAEREQGITIDVAYRYFSTARRKFIIADTPGHEQYTRNMATGASTADLAVILVDATKGLLAQTRRHAFIASLLGIAHALVAVNKMDLIEFSEDVFLRLEQDFLELARALGISSVQCVPISALDGDNVVARSEKTGWYTGPTLLEHLETVPVSAAVGTKDLRFPVQSVIRPDVSFRGFAGRVASGTLRAGDEIVALPSRRRTRVESIVSFDGGMESADAGQSVTVTLSDEIDVSRGDLLVAPDAEPSVSSRFLAMVVWLHEIPFELERMYLAKHAGRLVKLKATRIRYRVDVNELAESAADHLEMNEIGLVDFEASQALYFDAYKDNRTTGSLILIDALSNATVGAVMVREGLSDSPDRSVVASEILNKERRGKVAPEERAQRHGHEPGIFVVGGERALADRLERELVERGFEAVVVGHHEIPSSARRAFFAALWNVGVVAIVWAATRIRPRERGIFAEIAGPALFDLSAAEAKISSEMDWDEAMRKAETLRTREERFRVEEN
jgi:sulfate adenylyltransferase subunit 1